MRETDPSYRRIVSIDASDIKLKGQDFDQFPQMSSQNDLKTKSQEAFEDSPIFLK